jgi:uncharacterized membrane protein YiaA
MKTIFQFLQQFAVAIAIFFSFSPLLLNTVAVELGDPYATLFCWFLALTGTFIVTLLLWYLNAEWQIPHRGYLIAVGFGGVIGMILGWTSLAYLDSIVSNEIQQTVVSYSFIFQLGILWGFFVEWFTKPLKGEEFGS